jgi:hypothetical protein
MFTLCNLSDNNIKSRKKSESRLESFENTLETFFFLLPLVVDLLSSLGVGNGITKGIWETSTILGSFKILHGIHPLVDPLVE